MSAEVKNIIEKIDKFHSGQRGILEEIKTDVSVLDNRRSFELFCNIHSLNKGVGVHNIVHDAIMRELSSAKIYDDEWHLYEDFIDCVIALRSRSDDPQGYYLSIHGSIGKFLSNCFKSELELTSIKSRQDLNIVKALLNKYYKRHLCNAGIKYKDDGTFSITSIKGFAHSAQVEIRDFLKSDVKGTSIPEGEKEIIISAIDKLPTISID